MNFSKSIIFFFWLFASFSMSGCEKFLDVKPKGVDIIRTTDQYNGLFNNPNLNTFLNVRNQPGSITLLLGSAEMPLYMGDDVYSSSGFLNAIPNVAFQNGFKWEADLYQPTDEPNEWGAFYNQLYPYNLVAAGVLESEGGTESKKKELLAEAKACRAFNHFLVGNLFGQPYNEATATTDLGVPIVVEANIALENFPRATVQQLYDFVISELTEAIPNLPANPYSRVRLSKQGAEYMLGMVYFQMRNYSAALPLLNSCRTGLSGGSIVIGLNNFNTTMTNPQPTGWYTASQPWRGASGYPQQHLNSEAIFVRQLSISSTINRNCLFVKPSIMSLFETADLRGRLFLNKNVANGTVTLPGPIRNSPTSTNFGPNLPNLLLMQAECKARTNDFAGAKADLEELRKNRMPLASATVNAATQADMIRFCLNERHREFASTGMRWFDMRRLFLDATYNNLDRKKQFDAQEFILTNERLTMRIPPMIREFNPTMVDNP
jgi:hypothetical protein